MKLNQQEKLLFFFPWPLVKVFVVTSSFDGDARVWCVANGECYQTLSCGGGMPLAGGFGGWRGGGNDSEGFECLNVTGLDV